MPSRKPKSAPPQVRKVRLLFGARVAYLQLSGSQARIESVTVYQEVADQLVARGVNAFLLDIRQVSYPPSQLADIVARTEWLGRTYPPGRAALWHNGEFPYAVCELVSALQRCGHKATAVRSAMEARRFLIPRENADVWLIDTQPPCAAAMR